MNAYTGMLNWPVEGRDALPNSLWDAVSVARATGGVAVGEFQLCGVEIDSRDVREGDLFFALQGEAMDGHKFVDGALAKGAIAAVTDREITAPHIRVADTMAALVALGNQARERTMATIIGVTGSVGKTGVKEAIYQALDRSSRGNAHRSVKSYNNHVGVPLSLARMPARSRYGIFEMGMNHAGEIAALTRQVRPHVAVITTIAPAHIEMLGSEEAIADAKSEIFSGLEPDGTAVIPADSPHFARLKAAAEACDAQIVSFGRADHADVRLIDAVAAPGGGTLVTVDMGDRRLCYTVSAPGEHWVINSLAVMAAVRAAGGDLGSAGLALADMAGLAGRGARIDVPAEGGSAQIIDESYNANPASMRATLAQLARTEARRRIAVLGAMKELGPHGPGFHAALAEPLADSIADYAVLVGEEMTALADELGKGAAGALGKAMPFTHCATAAEALSALRTFGLERGDVVLIKGSNSVGLGSVVKALSGNAG